MFSRKYAFYYITKQDLKEYEESISTVRVIYRRVPYALRICTITQDKKWKGGEIATCLREALEGSSE